MLALESLNWRSLAKWPKVLREAISRYIKKGLYTCGAALEMKSVSFAAHPQAREAFLAQLLPIVC